MIDITDHLTDLWQGYGRKELIKCLRAKPTKGDSRSIAEEIFCYGFISGVIGHNIALVRNNIANQSNLN